MAALRADFALPLRSFALELALEVGGTVALVGPSGAGKTSVLRAIAGLVRPRAGRSRSATTSGSTAARALPQAGRAPRRARLPGVRALPAHDRSPERRVRGQGARGRVPRALPHLAPRQRAADGALRRRAAARRARPRARARPGRAPARRAAGRARRAHEGRRSAASCTSSCASSRCRRSSSRTTTKTQPRSPTGSACSSTGKLRQLGDAERARRPAGRRLRRLVHRRQPPARARAPAPTTS